MENNFWSKLKRPLFVMAPMEDVTDIAFRQMFAKYSKLGSLSTKYVSFTEFVSADGLVLAPEDGKKQLLSKLQFKENERPIVAQIFGANPENIEKAASIVAELGFDGIDINMGCPDRSVEKSGAGSALIKNPNLAVNIIRACKAGAGELPISVKTRIGYTRNEIETWIPELLKEMPVALTVHLRTRKELSDYAAHWELMPSIVRLRDKISPETLIIGNGDVRNIKEAQEKANKYGCDGVMIGRAIFGKPYFFSTVCNRITNSEKLGMLMEHLDLFEKYLLSKNFKGYHVMKKHFKAYVTGFKGAKELRVRLMDTNTPKEAKMILKDYLL